MRALALILLAACGENAVVMPDAGFMDATNIDAFTDAGQVPDGQSMDIAEGDVAFHDANMVDTQEGDAFVFDATDAETMPEPSECPASADIFCDDFEDGIDPRWTQDVGGGDTLEATDDAWMSDGAVRIRHDRSNHSRGMLRMATGDWPARFWGRMMIKINRLPERHGWLIDSVGPAFDGANARYRMDINRGVLNSRYVHRSIEQHGGARKYGDEVPIDQWMCVEWMFDTDTHGMRFFFDGDENEDMHVTGREDPRWSAPDIQEIAVGLYHIAPVEEAGTTMLLDGVAFGHERLGCY